MARLARGELEARVLDILWRADTPLATSDVRQRLASDPKLAYSTVMTILVRLWRKGLATRERAGRAYTYRAAISPEERTASRMTELLGAAADPALALTQFVDSLSSERREELRAALSRKRRRT